MSAGDIMGLGTLVKATHDGDELEYSIGTHGEHHALNSLAVVAAMNSYGIELEQYEQYLADFRATAGRGQEKHYQLVGGRVLFVDESYNANPLSMSATLGTLGKIFVQPNWPTPMVPRRIAIIGDMRELGEAADHLHRELRGPIQASKIDKVFACGPHMRALWDVLPDNIRGAYAEKSEGLIAPLLAAIAPGDVIMIKGSLGTRMAPVVEAVKAHLAEWEKAGKQ